MYHIYGKCILLTKLYLILFVLFLSSRYQTALFLILTGCLSSFCRTHIKSRISQKNKCSKKKTMPLLKELSTVHLCNLVCSSTEECLSQSIMIPSPTSEPRNNCRRSDRAWKIFITDSSFSQNLPFIACSSLGTEPAHGSHKH